MAGIPRKGTGWKGIIHQWVWCGLIAFSQPAGAGELSVLVNGIAKHLEERPGVDRRFDVVPKLDELYFDIGFIGFLMTRKTFNDNRPFPGVLPALTFGTAHLAVNMTYIPKMHPKLVPLWFFQLKAPIAKH